MDFDLDILIWLLIPLFGLLGRKRKKKTATQKTTVRKQEPVLVEAEVPKQPAPDSFEEALRQIKEALGERPKQEILIEEPIPKPEAKPLLVSSARGTPEKRPLEFHEHMFPTEDPKPLPPTGSEDRFEERASFQGDRFESLETGPEPSPKKSAEPEEVLEATESDDAYEASEQDTYWKPGTADLQRAFVWREILGPARVHRTRR
jgi:hypothetical protein